MNDGSVATLEEVIDIYANGGRLIESGALAGDGSTNPYKSGLVPGFTISDEEAADLVAFLNSLTNRNFTTDPRSVTRFLRKRLKVSASLVGIRPLAHFQDAA